MIVYHPKNSFCEICGKLLEVGQVSMCDKCFRYQYSEKIKELEEDQDEESDYELQGSL